MIVIPLIVTLIRPSSFLLTLLSTPLFYLAIPLMVCFFPAYAFARCHDLSWGNRPADQMKDVDKEDREKLEKKFTGTALYAPTPLRLHPLPNILGVWGWVCFGCLCLASVCRGASAWVRGSKGEVNTGQAAGQNGKYTRICVYFWKTSVFWGHGCLCWCILGVYWCFLVLLQKS